MTWQNRLTHHLAEVARLPYAPGQHDCALFAAGCVAAMTGVDYAAPYRGRYETLADGMALLQADGFEDHVALAAAHLAEIGPAYAQAGDVAVIETPDGPSLGIVQGAAVYVLTERGGVGLVPLRRVARAFRVVK